VLDEVEFRLQQLEDVTLIFSHVRAPEKQCGCAPLGAGFDF
jgi:hypothetical protein